MLQKHLENPWFSRLWILQEIQLGTRSSIIKCGEHEITWALFCRAILCIDGTRHGIPSELKESISFITDTCLYIPSASLYEILWCQVGRECADDRDRIYGLLNLLPPILGARLQVDYIKSQREIFQSFTRTRMEQVQRLELMRSCRLQENWRPSWVPNLGKGVAANVVPDACGYLASGLSAAIIRTDATTDFLDVTAIRVGIIENVSEHKFTSLDDINEFIIEKGLQE
ncbi:hypothetical protein F5Y16DRAFT_167932 [Xylariaceae sp. FL0255]|nr:hypothetical protein F5Y16DRAFT_167932 [Xylariaceae sp. FL0255]